MLPPKQRLHAVVRSAVEPDDWLEMNLELVQLECALQLGLELHPLDDAFVHLGLEQLVAAFVVALGHVHRDVGVTQELFGFGGAEPVSGQADPDACARIHLLALDFERGLQRRQGPPRHGGGLRGILDSVQEDRELVAAEACHRVRRPHCRLQSPRDLPKDGVAGRVPEAVVDGLEVVEIDEHDADSRAPTARPEHRVLHAVGEQGPIREVRHRIVERLVCELVLELLPLAHIAAVQDDAAHMLVLEKVRVLDLELQPFAVPVLQLALDDVRLGSSADIGLADPCEDLP